MKPALLLYNERSGRGTIRRNMDRIVSAFRQHGYALTCRPIDFDNNPFDDAMQPSLVVAAGGDGTINYVVNRMKQRGLDLPLGVIPSGTANDFAGALGMEHDPVQAAVQIASGQIRRIDCGCVNGLYFVNVFSFGIFTTTSQHTPDKRKHRLGRAAYLLEGAKEIYRMHGVPLRVVADGESFDFDSLLVLVFNGLTAGGFRLAPLSSVQDGVFDCIMLQRRSMLRSAWAMACYMGGGAPASVKRIRAQRIEMTSTVDEPTDVDGQPGARFPLHIECLPGALRVVCPADK